MQPGHATYLMDVFDKWQRRETVAWTLLTIRTNFPSAKAIAVQGISGLALGPIIAHLLDINLLVVRKPEDVHNHSGRLIESPTNFAGPYIILDDFVSWGSTKNRIYEAMRREIPDSVCLGMVEYHHRDISFVDEGGQWANIRRLNQPSSPNWKQLPPSSLSDAISRYSSATLRVGSLTRQVQPEEPKPATMTMESDSNG